MKHTLKNFIIVNQTNVSFKEKSTILVQLKQLFYNSVSIIYGFHLKYTNIKKIIEVFSVKIFIIC